MVKSFAQHRPFIFAVGMLGLFNFIMLAPGVILSLINLSENLVSETEEIHFYVKENNEKLVQSQVNEKILIHQIQDISDVKINHTESGKVLSLYFVQKSAKEKRVDALVNELQQMSTLSVKNAIFKSYLKSGLIDMSYQLYSQLIALLIFWTLYQRYFKSQQLEINHVTTTTQWVLGAVTVAFLLAFCMQLLIGLIAYLGVNFSQINDLYNDLFLSGWVMIVVAVILTPLLEELVFRGIVYKNFIIRHKKWIGALFTSLLFASMHQWQIWQFSIAVKLSHFMIMFIISMAFCWMFAKSARIWVSVICHGFYNAFLLLYS